MPTYTTPPWPSLWGTGTVTGTFLTIDGGVRVGSVRFTPRASTVVVLDGSHIIDTSSITVALDANGSLSTQLPASDDPNISPTYWTWQVEELDSDGSVLRTYDVEVRKGLTTALAQYSAVNANPGIVYLLGLLNSDQVTALVTNQVPGQVALSMANYLVKANNLSDLASAATARTNLGLGSAALQPTTAFDAAGAAAAAQAAAQGSSLQKAANLSDLASAVTARTNLGLGSAAVLAADTAASINTVAERDGSSQLNVAATPTAPAHATSKSYVDAQIDALSKGFLGTANDTTHSIGSLGAGSGSPVPFSAFKVLVFTETRRVRIDVDMRYAQSSATLGFGWIKAAYAPGDLSANWLTTYAGLALPTGTVQGGIAGQSPGSATDEVTVEGSTDLLIGAGTYTFFGVIARNEGTSFDQFRTFRVRVYDNGNS